MSARKRKKQVVSHLFMCMLGRHLEAWLNTPDADEKKLIADGDLKRRMALAELLESPAVAEGYQETNGKMKDWLESRAFKPGEYEALQAIEDAKVEYVVVKVNGGEVVDTFDNRDDAAKLIMKHVRQKKAKLRLLEGAGVVPFTLEELEMWA